MMLLRPDFGGRRRALRTGIVGVLIGVVAASGGAIVLCGRHHSRRYLADGGSPDAGTDGLRKRPTPDPIYDRVVPTGMPFAYPNCTDLPNQPSECAQQRERMLDDSTRERIDEER